MINRKIILLMSQSPGDTLAGLVAYKAFYDTYPGQLTLDFHGHFGPSRELLANGKTNPPGNDLTANMPWITPLRPSEAEIIELGYLKEACGSGNGDHFYRGCVNALERKVGLHIEYKIPNAHMVLSEAEKQLREGLPQRYILIAPSYKNDFTAKQWSFARWQQVIDHFKDRIAFVQVGGGDVNPTLQNCISLVGQTDMRGLAQVTYRAEIVISLVSLMAHMSAAIPMPDGRQRPTIVLGGRREPRSWAAINGQTFLGADGYLACGEALHSGCWMDKAKKIDASESVCRTPMDDGRGQVLAGCLWGISADDVIKAIERYL